MAGTSVLTFWGLVRFTWPRGDVELTPRGWEVLALLPEPPGDPNG